MRHVAGRLDCSGEPGSLGRGGSHEPPGRVMSMAAICLHTLHNSIQRVRQSLARTRNSPRELNQARDAPWMSEEKFCERSEVSSLVLDIKQDAGRSRERVTWRVCDNA